MYKGKILHHKSVKTKSHKDLETKSYVCRRYMRKPGTGSFCPTPAILNKVKKDFIIDYTNYINLQDQIKKNLII